MAKDHFTQLTHYIKQNPKLLQSIAKFIEYLNSSFCRRQVHGKSRDEFSDIVLTTNPLKNIEPVLVNFIIDRIFPYLTQDSNFIREKLEKINNAGQKDALKILQTLLKEKKKFFFFKFSTNAKKQPAKKITSHIKFKKQFEEFGVETIISSPPRISLTAQFFSNKVKTILSTGSKFEEPELEALRVYTLVSLNSHRMLIKWHTLPKEQDLFKCPAKRFLDVINGNLKQSIYNKMQRNLLRQLKSTLIIRSKLLTNFDIILNIINYGSSSLNHTINQVSGLTNNKKINRKIGYYLNYLVQAELTRHNEIFRKNLDSSKTYADLKKLLSKYSLKSSSIIKKYPSLKIIQSVKKIRKLYEQKPHQLTKIMNKYLGAHGEVNVKQKLQELLKTSTIDAEISKTILRIKTVDSLEKKLTELKNKKQLEKGVSKLLTLIKTFLDPYQHLSFKEFKVSLNRFAPALRQKVIAIVRTYNQQELKSKVNQLITSNNKILPELLKTLKNPKYDDHLIKLYGYSPLVIVDKINSVKHGHSAEQEVNHFFSGSKVPASFLNVIIREKSR